MVAEVSRRDQCVVRIHDSYAADEGSSAEAFFREVSAAHLGVGVEAGRTGVDDLPTKFHHGCTACKVTEQEARPVSHNC